MTMIWKRGRMMKRLRRILWVLVVLVGAVAVVAAVSGCTTTVTPPGRVSDPVDVYVLDYGRTPALLMPTPEGGAVRYAYGDWTYYAEGKRNPFFNGVPALLWPTAAGVGRQALSRMPEAEIDAVASATGLVPVELYVVAVERDRAATLYRALEDHFEQRWEQRLHNPSAQLTFVPHDDAYSLAHDSNDVVAQWLERMGAQTSGPFWAIHWRVVEPE